MKIFPEKQIESIRREKYYTKKLKTKNQRPKKSFQKNSPAESPIAKKNCKNSEPKKPGTLRSDDE